MNEHSTIGSSKRDKEIKDWKIGNRIALNRRFGLIPNMRRGGYARKTADKALTSDISYETLQVYPLEVRFTYDAGFSCISSCCLFPRPLVVCAQRLAPLYYSGQTYVLFLSRLAF